MTAVEMTVDVQAIPSTGLERTWTCDANILDLDPDVVTLRTPATITVRLLRSGREVRVQGTVRMCMGMVCGRCLESFALETALPLEIMYIPRGDDGTDARGNAVSDPDFDISLALYDGIRCNLQPEVRDMVLLSVPMVPVCQPACHGLCPRCGENLNLGACDCAPAERDSPFDALNDLKAKLMADTAVPQEDD